LRQPSSSLSATALLNFKRGLRGFARASTIMLRAASIGFPTVFPRAIRKVLKMFRIGYPPGAFDLFDIGHLHLLRQGKTQCGFLIAGVVSDEVLFAHKGITSVIPLAERLEIVCNVRCVDAAIPTMIADKRKIWRELRFDIFFKGDDWRGAEKGDRLERDFGTVGVEVIYFPYTSATSSSMLRRALQNIDAMAGTVRRAV
jgi:glycerol-3-phosphate cytidylyltransferase